MRNNSSRYKRRRIHMPSSEWSKIVRFNGRDYLMKSVYDRNTELDIDDDELWNREHAINEDFFDDFGEDLLVNNQKSAKQKVIEGSDYPMMTASGDVFDVSMSDDEIKNAIFHLIVNFVTVYDSTGFTNVDNFLYESGKMGHINSYKLAFDDIVYENGTFSFVPKNAQERRSGKGYLQIYFTGEREANFRIDCPDISFHRPTSQVNINYEQLCDLISIQTSGILRKKATEYYGQTLQMMFNELMRENVGLTLVRRKANLPGGVFQQIESPVADAAFIKRNFDVVYKYSAKNPGDYSVLSNAMNADMEMIESIYNGDRTDTRMDDMYVLLGGRETYIESLYKSIWVGHYTRANVFKGNFVPVRFFTPDPKTPVMKIEHNMLLVPLASFVTATPGLLMHILS